MEGPEVLFELHLFVSKIANVLRFFIRKVTLGKAVSKRIVQNALG